MTAYLLTANLRNIDIPVAVIYEESGMVNWSSFMMNNIKACPTLFRFKQNLAVGRTRFPHCPNVAHTLMKRLCLVDRNCLAVCHIMDKSFSCACWSFVLNCTEQVLTSIITYKTLNSNPVYFQVFKTVLRC